MKKIRKDLETLIDSICRFHKKSIHYSDKDYRVWAMLVFNLLLASLEQILKEET